MANLIFKIIDVYRNLDIEKWLFLIQIEKYLEYSYYDMKELSIDMDLQIPQIMKLVDKYIGSSVPILELDEKMKSSLIKKIHNLMIDNRILPRELSIAYNLRSFIDKNQLDIDKYKDDKETDSLHELNIDNEKILSILFPDTEERRKEIYCEAINFAEVFVNSDDSNELACKQCDEECFMKRPDYIYYKSGIDISFNDIEDDLVSEILRQNFEEDFLVCYGFCLTMAIDFLIRRNLLMVKDFIKNELFIFEKPKEIMVFIDILIRISKKEAKSLSKEHFDDIYERFIEVST